jgi:hypothetical protein
MARQPIEPSIFRRAELLLARGNLSQAKVARRVGISKSSVQKIAKRRLEDLARREADDAPRLVTNGSNERIMAAGVRCGCGALVKIIPCRTCKTKETLLRLRAIVNRAAESPAGAPRRKRRRGPRAGDDQMKLAIDLVGEDRDRFLFPL